MSQKSVFPFLCLKYAACSFIAGKTCSGFFAVKLGCFQCYCTGKRLSTSLQQVTLIFTWFHSKQRFRLFFLLFLSYAVFSIIFARKIFSLCLYLNCSFSTLYLTENMFWVFSNCSGSCEPYLTKNSNLVFRCKIRCFKLHRNESMFWFVGIKI